MYVCLCKSVTDREIRRMVEHDGVATMRQLRDACGVATQCGRCAQCAKTVLAEAVADCRACEAGVGFARLNVPNGQRRLS